MKKLQLLKELRRHRKLAEQRMIDKNSRKMAKILGGFVMLMMVVYLVMFAIIISLAANETRTMSSIEVICGLIPFFMTIDFFVRFLAQQTPSQIVKPYLLLPISRYTCVDLFIANQFLSASCFIWYILLVPFCLMSVLFSYGFWACVGILFLFWILELCMSQFYTIVRTLITDTLLWWTLPISIILITLLPGCDFSKISYVISNFKEFYNIGDVVRFYGNLGTSIETGRPWGIALLMAVLAVLTAINRRIQFAHIMAEVTKVNKAVVVSGKSRTKWLEKLGIIGLFLELEIKTQLRNKNPRKGLIMGIGVIVFISLINIFTTVYDNMYMTNFWCFYNYAIFGTITLTKIMGNEGNYIDGLMVRKENVLNILKAKYIFVCLVLFLPFLLMLPSVISGKWSILMLLSFGIFTAGFEFLLMFQLAVYNKTSQPLNTKFISKTGLENSKLQVIIELVCMFVPVVVVSILQVAFGGTWAYIIMSLIGIALITTSGIWLRNIYERFMLRRYENMNGFRASR